MQEVRRVARKKARMREEKARADEAGADILHGHSLGCHSFNGLISFTESYTYLQSDMALRRSDHESTAVA